MATDPKHGWRVRSKRTMALAVGLVGILIGVAVAYFLTEASFAGNTASGGQLTVTSSLPIDFTSNPLYPVNNPGGTTAGSAPGTFTIDNNNTVTVDYTLYATCVQCAVPNGTTPSRAQADQIDQFNNLWVRITNATGATGAGTWDAPLKDLNATKSLDLGEIAAGKSAAYSVQLWLKNDSGRAQPQQVLNSWEFVINAKTPKNGPATTTTLLP
ncbi:MAG TPA: hypothetical protein VFA94_02510 [Acidimicrobiales bacterium]|nr:hypothetical protein [Acidimicrobiales bacterium]